MILKNSKLQSHYKPLNIKKKGFDTQTKDNIYWYPGVEKEPINKEI